MTSTKLFSDTDSVFGSSDNDGDKRYSDTSSNVSLKSFGSEVNAQSAQSMTSETSAKSSGSGGSKRPGKNPEKQVKVAPEEDTKSERASSKASKRGPWQTGIAQSKTTIKVRKDGSGVYQMKWGRPKTSCNSRISSGVAVRKSTRGWVRVSSRGDISVSNPPCETTSESSVSKQPLKTDNQPMVAGGLKKDYWGYGKITEYLDTGCKTYEVMGVQKKKPFFKVGNGIYQVFITHVSKDGQTQGDTERKSVDFDKDCADDT